MTEFQRVLAQVKQEIRAAEAEQDLEQAKRDRNTIKEGAALRRLRAARTDMLRGVRDGSI